MAMRMNFLMAGVLAASMFAVPAVYAQGTGADTTCADFVKLDATAQADILSQLSSGGGMAAANAGNSGVAANAPSDEKGNVVGGETTATSGGMDVEDVLAACEADPSHTVGTAMSDNAGAQ